MMKNDSWDCLSFMVVGETDEEWPRTEIYVIETGEFGQVFKSLLSEAGPVTKRIPAQVNINIQEKDG